MVKMFKKMKFPTIINLLITSIPPSYDVGYLEDTRHLITVAILQIVENKCPPYHVNQPILQIVENTCPPYHVNQVNVRGF